LARRHCLGLLQPFAGARPTPAEIGSLFRTLWPNSWRSGLLGFSTFLTTNANSIVCMSFLGLAANAQYGLSVQLVSFAQGMAMAWIWVKWPLIGQHRARRDYPSLRRLFWQRLHLQVLTFVLMTAVLIPLAPLLLDWLHTDKSVLPVYWLVLLGINALLELHLASWSTLITTTNRFPFLVPIIVSNVCSFLLALTLVRLSSLGPGALILAPLITGGLVNYWYWPRQGARTLDTNWRQFVFSRPG
jgi:O-antigen/teichoic acid export membrane protein